MFKKILLTLVGIASFGSFTGETFAQIYIPTKPSDLIPKKPGDLLPRLPRFPRSGDDSSSLAVSNPPYIDANGNVYSGTANTGQTPVYVGKATLKYNRKGEASWTSNYSDTQGRPESRRAPRHDRIQMEENVRAKSIYRIDDSGRVYRHSTYVGQGARTRTLRGNSGWEYRLSNGKKLHRLDGESQVRVY